MPIPSLQPPSVNKRTVWPVLLAVLHGLSFIAGFCVVIPVSLSDVSTLVLLIDAYLEIYNIDFSTHECLFHVKAGDS